MYLTSVLRRWKTRAVVRASIARRVSRKMQEQGLLLQHLRILLLWLFTGIVLVSLLWGLTESKLSREKEHVKEHAFRQAASLSKAYAEQLARSVGQIDQITLSLKYYWQKTPGALNLQEQLRNGLYPASADLYVTIVDRDGKPVTSTLDNVEHGPRIANRDHFLAHKNDASIGLRISEPVLGLRLNKTVILFSRRLDAADGSFDGAVVVAIEPRYLASFTDASAMPEGDFLSVTNADGALLAQTLGGSADLLLNPFPVDAGI